MNETMGKLSAKSEKIRIWMDVRSDDSAFLPSFLPSADAAFHRHRQRLAGTTIAPAAEQAKERLFVGTETFSLSNLFRVRTN